MLINTGVVPLSTSKAAIGTRSKWSVGLSWHRRLRKEQGLLRRIVRHGSAESTGEELLRLPNAMKRGHQAVSLTQGKALESMRKAVD
jgi:hypothetical protein